MTDYYETVHELAQNHQTTGTQTESNIKYTQLSAQRMKRWMKTGEILPELKEAISKIDQPQNWTFITESWCGDASHAIMFIEKMADLNPNIKLNWKLRDENLDLIDQHLTNGARSIPKLFAQDVEGNDLFEWGPRPKHIQEKFNELKKQEATFDEIQLTIQKMYNADKGVTMQKEILALLK
ncbi:thioredoxin family protein [Paracrocinitomix mangrovi]|uniref:thioredoxin family protein n=1 Tax=Paracrocinitomix mangrovi TaxID=2862509 RepID=UPI001C8D8275|nr:thioredoxin family protein [Paracrocinitomix mangrovi]UKN01701.1 thioredoxin family protein [Paracrocinitomix mangrovi]